MQSIILIRRKATPTDTIYIENPCSKLAKEYGFRFHILNTENPAELIKYFLRLRPEKPILIISRTIPSWMISLIQHDRPTFRRIYYLFDDDFEAAANSVLSPASYRIKLARIFDKEFYKLLNISDHKIVTSRYLASRFDALLLEPTTYVNLASLAHHRSKTIQIGYFATASHLHDLENIAPAIRLIHNEYAQVRFRIIIGKVVPDVLNGLSRVEFISQLNWPEYRNYISNTQVSIFLAPLSDTPFNRAKSFIKFCESAMTGAAGIFSNRPPYSDIISHQVNGLLIDDGITNWCDGIKYLINNPEEILRIARNGQALANQSAHPDLLVNFWRQELFSCDMHEK